MDPSIAISTNDLVTVVSAASLTLLRRDMSLNRRFYAWLLGVYYENFSNELSTLSNFLNKLIWFACVYVYSGTDIKGEMVAPHSTLSTTLEEHTSYYFNTYSRDYLVQVSCLCLHIDMIQNLKESKRT